MNKMEAIQKNIIAVKEHSEQTRLLFRELEVKMNTIETMNQRIIQMEQQLQSLQVKVFSGGATSGN